MIYNIYKRRLLNKSLDHLINYRLILVNYSDQNRNKNCGNRIYNCLVLKNFVGQLNVLYNYII